ncbi:MAG TPA: OmpA family protein, partial [Fimbriimonas sp.]|nr:OmpA family protein [Fimbriimonas sp.]
GAEVSAVAYGEQDASYWERYYRGTQEKDKTGVMVDLGGSSVNNLADNMFLFGQVSGSANIFASVYKMFGEVVKAQYPDLLPSFPPAAEIFDPQYLKQVASIQGFTEADIKRTDLVASTTKPATGTETRTISNRAWNIQFETGRATFKPESTRVLDQLIQELSVSTTTSIEVAGHTDNVGNPQANMALSEARAFAVKNWLSKRAPKLFPSNRVTVTAFGSTRPVQPNTTGPGRAANRRVEIKVRAQR